MTVLGRSGIWGTEVAEDGKKSMYCFGNFRIRPEVVGSGWNTGSSTAGTSSSTLIWWRKCENQLPTELIS